MSEQLIVDDRQTTIKLKQSTRDRLQVHGRKDQSYDDLVNEILDKIEEGDKK